MDWLGGRRARFEKENYVPISETTCFWRTDGTSILFGTQIKEKYTGEFFVYGACRKEPVACKWMATVQDRLTGFVVFDDEQFLYLSKNISGFSDLVVKHDPFVDNFCIRIEEWMKFIEKFNSKVTSEQFHRSSFGPGFHREKRIGTSIEIEDCHLLDFRLERMT